MWVESTFGVGSAFHFTVSLGRAASPVPAPEPSAPIVRTRPLRVLLAEDNPVNRLLAVKLIEKLGHSVVTANDGRQAVDRLAREPFDAVLMDVQMPELNGFEATAEIRRAEHGTGRHQFIAAMTAHALKGDRERCLDAGMTSYISKPIDLEALAAVLAEAAEHCDRIEAASSCQLPAILRGPPVIFTGTDEMPDRPRKIAGSWELVAGSSTRHQNVA